MQAFSTIRNTVTLPNGILFTKHSYEEHGDLHLFKFILYGFGPTPTVVLRRTCLLHRPDPPYADPLTTILKNKQSAGNGSTCPGYLISFIWEVVNEREKDVEHLSDVLTDMVFQGFFN